MHLSMVGNFASGHVLKSASVLINEAASCAWALLCLLDELRFLLCVGVVEVGLEQFSCLQVGLGQQVISQKARATYLVVLSDLVTSVLLLS
jgi:hypothetical protein